MLNTAIVLQYYHMEYVWYTSSIVIVLYASCPSSLSEFLHPPLLSVFVTVVWKLVCMCVWCKQVLI